MSKTFTDLEQNAWGGFLGTYAKMNKIIEEDLQAHSHITHVEFEVLLRLSWDELTRMDLRFSGAEHSLAQRN